MRLRVRSVLASGSGWAIAILVGATLSMAASGVFRPAVDSPTLPALESSAGDLPIMQPGPATQAPVLGAPDLAGEVDMGGFPIQLSAHSTPVPGGDNGSPSRGIDRVLEVAAEH
jgi:hypothetical protein